VGRDASGDHAGGGSGGSPAFVEGVGDRFVEFGEQVARIGRVTVIELWPIRIWIAFG
jgi:hypothetical protein